VVLNEVISSMKACLVALTGSDRAPVDLRPMDFAFVAFEATFVTEILPITGCVVAVVRAVVLVLVSPEYGPAREQVLLWTSRLAAPEGRVFIGSNQFGDSGLLDGTSNAHVHIHREIVWCLWTRQCCQWMLDTGFRVVCLV